MTISVLATEKKRVRVPKGTSAYQAAWIADQAGEDVSDADSDEDEDELMVSQTWVYESPTMKDYWISNRPASLLKKLFSIRPYII